MNKTASAVFFFPNVSFAFFKHTLAVTSPEAFKETYRVFQETFKAANVEKVFDSVIGIVVQPGVEFGDADLFQYNRENAKELTDTLKREFDSFVFEGHSTDYQTPTHLREMVEDGITILKVGPALTFAYREALFALAHIESQICTDPSNFVDVLEAAMLDQPGNWQKHYHGTEAELFIKRKYAATVIVHVTTCRYLQFKQRLQNLLQT
ncbi:class II D-tagatose-bisphosphate aldolase non-catalytic subunit [Erysipelothrix piscisicarius]|uniref:class II D-tagatose-bisphosphate aldolase non-catalytic subunit n=1 Tax=Erysipelothrix piscisicarius TaxID=2485784 RepID=UPI002F951F9E